MEFMSSLDHMHKEHEEWRREDAMWLDDLRAWQDQNKRALDDVRFVATQIERFQALLATHRADIRDHENALREHEHSIAALTKWQIADDRPEKAQQHEQFREARSTLALRHDTIKHARRLLLVELGRLKSLLSSPLMPGDEKRER